MLKLDQEKMSSLRFWEDEVLEESFMRAKQHLRNQIEANYNENKQ